MDTAWNDDRPEEVFAGEQAAKEESLSERLMILKMVAEGKISAEQGASLLASLEADQPQHPVDAAPASSRSPHWFRIRVDDLHSGRTKTQINIPFGLMDWGLRIGAHFTPEVSGIKLEELRQTLRSGADGKLIEVFDEEDGEHVAIYVD